MALTITCLATSFEPQTTSALPLAAFSSAATNLTALSILPLPVGLLPGKVVPAISLYRLISAAPSSDGLVRIRVSAFDPVLLIPASNWIWRDIFLPCSDLLLRLVTHCVINSDGDIQVPRKSAPKLTITSALSKR